MLHHCLHCNKTPLEKFYFFPFSKKEGTPATIIHIGGGFENMWACLDGKSKKVNFFFNKRYYVKSMIIMWCLLKTDLNCLVEITTVHKII